MIKSNVTVYRAPWTPLLRFSEDRENWYVEREPGFSYQSKLKGEEAAEEAFHLTNAPEDCLEDNHKEILAEQQFKGPSLSVGDVVRVEPIVKGSKMPEYYLCKSFGWERYGGDVIQLLKHLI
jgi:hypothetical protein